MLMSNHVPYGLIGRLVAGAQFCPTLAISGRSRLFVASTDPGAGWMGEGEDSDDCGHVCTYAAFARKDSVVLAFQYQPRLKVDPWLAGCASGTTQVAVSRNRGQSWAHSSAVVRSFSLGRAACSLVRSWVPFPFSCTPRQGTTITRARRIRRERVPPRCNPRCRWRSGTGWRCSRQALDSVGNQAWGVEDHLAEK